MKKAVRLRLALLLFVVTLTARAQDQRSELQRKLEAQFQLTRISADRADIVTAGSILVLHKDGLKLCTVLARVGLSNVYKDGRLTTAMSKWSLKEAIVQSDMPVSTIPIRNFNSDEKIWLTGISADKSGIVLKVYTDAYDDIRYYGQIEIQPSKKGAATDEELLSEMAEVVTLDDGKAPTITSNDPKSIIKKRMLEKFKLTTTSDGRADIVKAGSILQLHKDGQLMWSADTPVPPICILKNGKLTMPFMLRANVGAALRKIQPGTNDYQLPSRTFVAGEKVWVIGITVTDQGVTLTLFSDAYNNVRYYGQLWFQFPKGTVPNPDDFMASVDDVVTAEPPPDDVAGADDASSPEAAPEADPTPALEAVPPPPAPADAAPAQDEPKTVSLGMTKDEVLAVLGKPNTVAIVGRKETHIYKDMKVIFINGKVTDIQ